MASREVERLVFEALLKAAPDFAGERVADWKQPVDAKDFPDVICRTESGRCVGVELGEWLNEGQLANSRGLQVIQDSVLQVIAPQPTHSCENISIVWLHVRRRLRVRPADGPALRAELLALIDKFDQEWQYAWRPSGHTVTDLAGWPTLARYAEAVRLWSRWRWVPDGEPRWVQEKTWPAGIDWIVFPARGGAFSEKDMIVPLMRVLQDKVQHYGGKAGFDRVYLVVYYDMAVLYNSPVETPTFTFENAAAEAREVIAGDRGIFDAIFLFVAIQPGSRLIPVA
jgi:hypothetical protein